MLLWLRSFRRHLGALCRGAYGSAVKFRFFWYPRSFGSLFRVTTKATSPPPFLDSEFWKEKFLEIKDRFMQLDDPIKFGIVAGAAIVALAFLYCLYRICCVKRTTMVLEPVVVTADGRRRVMTVSQSRSGSVSFFNPWTHFGEIKELYGCAKVHPAEHKKVVKVAAFLRRRKNLARSSTNGTGVRSRRDFRRSGFKVGGSSWQLMIVAILLSLRSLYRTSLRFLYLRLEALKLIARTMLILIHTHRVLHGSEYCNFWKDFAPFFEK